MNDQVSPAETIKILELAAQCAQLDGDFVEFGCYRGDTSVELAKILESANHPGEHKPWVGVGLCAANSSLGYKDLAIAARSVPKEDISAHSPHKLYVYDSFAGLPAKSPEDESAAGVNFQAGALHVSRRALIDKLKKHGIANVVIKKAWFSDLTPQDLPQHIVFAFLDGDFYESQSIGLRLVAPLLDPQGIVICHDYNNPELPGATRAVDEFLQNHPDFQLTIFQTLAILIL